MNTTTPTPRTDAIQELSYNVEHDEEVALAFTACRTLERELTAVTEQRDAANAEFYRYYGLWDRATKQLETVTEQRDRLEKQRDLLIEVLEVTLNATVLNHRRDRWHSDAEYALNKIKLNLKYE